MTQTTTHLSLLIECCTGLQAAIDGGEDETTLTLLQQLHQRIGPSFSEEMLMFRGVAERRLGRSPVRIDVYGVEGDDNQPWVQILEETGGRILGQALLGKYWNIFAAGTAETFARMAVIPGKGTTWWLNETPPDLNEDLEDDE